MIHSKLKKAAALSLLTLTSINVSTALADNGDGDDLHNFASTPTVNVYLNSDSFSRQGFPARFEAETLEKAVRKAIDNWVQITGLKLNVVLQDAYSSRYSAGPNEIVIRAAQRKVVSDSDTVLADASYGDDLNRSNIIFYRQNKAGVNFDWNVFPTANITEETFLGTLTHEMGHSFGLGHNDGKRIQTVMNPNKNQMDPYGPYIEDVEDIVDLYGKRDATDLKALLAVDNGSDWIHTSTFTGISSSMPVSASFDSSRMFMTYTNDDKHPTFLESSNLLENPSNASVLTGQSSLYGTASHGYDDEYMMAFADSTNANYVRILRLNDNLSSLAWSYLPGNSLASGAPDIHKLSTNTWIVVYPKLISNNNFSTGKVVSRISTDDGANWGEEVELYANKSLRALRGVSVTSNGPSDIRIGFALSTNDVYWGRRAGSMVEIKAHLDNNNNLVGDTWGATSSFSMLNEPSLSRTNYGFIMGYRGIWDEILSASISDSGRRPRWRDQGPAITELKPIAPSVSASPDRPWTFMFYQD